MRNATRILRGIEKMKVTCSSKEFYEIIRKEEKSLSKKIRFKY